MDLSLVSSCSPPPALSFTDSWQISPLSTQRVVSPRCPQVFLLCHRRVRNFTWTEGYEKILASWYKRVIGDEYSVLFFLSDLLAAAVEYPRFLDIGGNTGNVDTFTGVEIMNLTGGVFNGATLLEGNNAIYLAFQSIVFAVPGLMTDLVAGLLSTLLGSSNTTFQIFSAVWIALNSASVTALRKQLHVRTRGM
jgi:hypothetical protein